MKFIVDPIKFANEISNDFNTGPLSNCPPYEPVTCGLTRLCWSYCVTECYYHNCTRNNKDTPANK